MRHPLRAWLLPVLAGALPAYAEPPLADEPVVEDAHVEAALLEAKGNRAELERVLAHFAASQDADAELAARFLIANMPGRGHVVTALKSAGGEALWYDPLAYDDFEQALRAYEALEKRHGKIDFARDRLVSDLETLTAAFLIEHVERAVAVWRDTPRARRVSRRTFLEHVLPYRGSEEPAEAWLRALSRRYGAGPADLVDAADPQEVWRFVNRDVAERIRFDERYYLHPTDQGFAEMSRSRMGRCEDMTNLTTYSARALGLATAADYTPAWAHSDNNHAWNVLLDRHGRGSDPGQAHAAKVYRKTFALQRGNLAYRLPEGREAPNRFLSSRSYADVTDQYGPTTDVSVALDPAAVGEERFAYLCVFNGGEWVAIHWAEIVERRATFDRMGRGGKGVLYLPAVHDGKALVPAAAPLLLHADGRVEPLGGEGPSIAARLTAVRPPHRSPDTHVETPTVELAADVIYDLKRWAGADWQDVRTLTAEEAAAPVEGLVEGGLYWLVARESRRLERPFTLAGGRQRFW
jgi:hypothetical protein